MRQLIPAICPQPVPLPPTLGGIVSSATSIGSRDAQQDACYHATLPGAKVVILADGVGQYQGSDLIASRAVVEVFDSLSGLLNAGHRVSEAMLRQVVATAAERTLILNQELQRRGEEGGGSTLLVAIETSDYFYVAAVGDGAVVFVDGQSKVVRNALVGQAGRKLRGYIGSEAVHPTILSYPKDNPDGHILFVATDGVATSLQSQHARRRAEEVRETTTIALILGEIRATPRIERQSVLSILIDWVEGRRETVVGGDGNTWIVSYAQDNRSIGVLIDEAFVQASARP